MITEKSEICGPQVGNHWCIQKFTLCLERSQTKNAKMQICLYAWPPTEVWSLFCDPVDIYSGRLCPSVTIRNLPNETIENWRGTIRYVGCNEVRKLLRKILRDQRKLLTFSTRCNCNLVHDSEWGHTATTTCHCQG